MRVARADLKQLRLPFTIAVLLLVLGAVALVTTVQQLDAATKIRDAARLSRVGAQERVSRVSEEERELRENLVYYDQMLRSGMIGEHNRLDWIETITKIKTDRRLFEIRYSFDAQRALDYPGIVATNAAEFLVSRVKLDMLLLHEGDLVNFLTDMRSAAKSHVSVRRCTVQRIDRGPGASATALLPHLRAECELDLVSVRGVKPG